MVQKKVGYTHDGSAEAEWLPPAQGLQLSAEEDAPGRYISNQLPDDAIASLAQGLH